MGRASQFRLSTDPSSSTRLVSPSPMFLLPEVSSTSLTAFSTPTTPPPLPQLLAQPPLFQLSPAQAAHLMPHSHLASLHPPPSPRSQRAPQRLLPPALPEPHQCRLV